jgi:hypothetical protein
MLATHWRQQSLASCVVCGLRCAAFCSYGGGPEYGLQQITRSAMVRPGRNAGEQIHQYKLRWVVGDSDFGRKQLIARAATVSPDGLRVKDLDELRISRSHPLLTDSGAPSSVRRSPESFGHVTPPMVLRQGCSPGVRQR